MTDDTRLETALQLASQGLGIFPLAPNSKQPLEGTQGFHDATTDPDLIRQWFLDHPNCNYGIRTGYYSTAQRTLFVCDLDVKDDVDGRESFAKLLEDQDLPATRIHSTPRGGFHLLFWTRRYVRSLVGIVPGVDTRGDGGYIVGPESLNGENGWEVVEDVDIAEAPEWLVDRIIANSREARTHAVATGDGKIPEGARNRILTEHAGRLVNIGFKGDGLLVLLQHLNREQCVPPMSEREVLKIYSSAERSFDKDARDELYAKGLVIRDRLLESSGNKLVCKSLGALTQRGRPEPPVYIVENLVPATVFTLIAPGGLSKSTIALWWSIHIAVGRDVMGHAVAYPGPVVYVSAEDELSVIQFRVNEMLDALDLSDDERDLLDRNLYLVDVSERAYVRLVEMVQGTLTITHFLSQLSDVLEAVEPVLLWLDPAVFFNAEESHLNDGTSLFLRTLRGMTSEAQSNGRHMAVGVVHHTSKVDAREAPIDAHSGRGGSAFGDNARAVFVMTKHLQQADRYPIPAEWDDEDAEATVVRVNQVKNSYGPLEVEPFWIKRTGFSFEWRRGEARTPFEVQAVRLAQRVERQQEGNRIREDEAQERHTEYATTAWELINEHARQAKPPRSQSQWVTELTPILGSGKAAKAALKHLRDEGAATLEGTGANTRFLLVDSMPRDDDE